MKSAPLFLVVLLFISCFAGGPVDYESYDNGPATIHARFDGEENAEELMVSLVNDARADAGLPPLAVDELLTQAARQHSWEMISMDYFSHTSPVPGNESVPQRVANASSTAVWVGENIGAEYRSRPYEYKTLTLGAFDGLMNSPPHRANILDADYNTIGVGIAHSERDGMAGIHVTQVFAARCFELDTINVVPHNSRYRLRLRGRQLVDGYGGVFISGGYDDISDYVTVPAGDDGAFSLDILLRPDSGAYTLKLGLGSSEYGSKDIYNEFSVDTNQPTDRALIIGADPW